MTKNIYCHKCETRVLGCHDGCDKYIPNDYINKGSGDDYKDYLGKAKARMKRSKNLFRRGVKHEQ